MRLPKFFSTVAAPACLGALAVAQHAQTSAVVVAPNNSNEVWVANRDNNSITLIDIGLGAPLAEIAVGVRPRTLAITPDGATILVANQRGNVPVDVNFITPFTGNEIRGSVSVVDTGSLTVTNTLTTVGVEPYGIAIAPNGKYFAVSGMRSGTVKFYALATLVEVASFQFDNNLNFITGGKTIADVDENRDGIPDLGDPRGFVIRSDSTRIYTTHCRSSHSGVLDVTLDVNGLPTSVALATKIDTNEYPFDPFYNPTPVQNVESQGLPRFAEDIALSPDGTRALVPHVLHNINHDVNFDWQSVFPGFPGDFANRVYPALTVIDAAADSYDPGNDNSNRLHNELSDPLRPAQFAALGKPGNLLGDKVILGGLGSPVLGGGATFVVEGVPPTHSALLVIGPKIEEFNGLGFIYAGLRATFPMPPSGQFTLPIPNIAQLEGASHVGQVIVSNSNGAIVAISNGLEFVMSATPHGLNKMGERAGQPSRVAYNTTGTRALMLNRGSEDVFMYNVNGSDMTLRSVFPPRADFEEREALDTTTPMGDLPLGMAIVDDLTTANDDARVFILNELTRTLSVLRVSWSTGSMFKEANQIPTLLGQDLYTFSERLGDELLEDASRAQTTGAPGTVGGFNNSCGSCHFEGGEDGNVWQRPAGPRSTMPFYDGTMMTGLILWKGVRLNMGETGPMHGGENGGTGILSDAEQQGMVDAHEKIPVPLNANWDLVNGTLTADAKFGQDLFFGSNDTGMNRGGRLAGCGECHPREDAVSLSPRAFTGDFIDPMLSMGENLENVDPFCFSLQGNIVALNVRNVNSGCDIDFDFDGFPDLDRNLDGYDDIETYAIMNTDKDDDFTRDDPNSYMCPEDPSDPNGPLKLFLREMRAFSIPTKLGVVTSSPYFHDHSAYSLRMVLDPEAQAIDPVYGTPAFGVGAQPYPGLNKFFNEFHDVRGHEQFVQGASKVQLNLNSTNVQADIEALLAFIQSL
ncbi:MAG TPA: beta-propeller fold lactonase family protein [Planctomycetota bacterium]|nr:beta-propeller fold lactonase family protein [Planctomycetota bacterium]